MIARLAGTVVDREGFRLTVDCGGVGYDVVVPPQPNDGLSGSGERCLFIHTHVREESIELFGFKTKAARAMFRVLISVSGIGPKTAMAILGEFEPSELAGVIALEKYDRLTRIKGIGKKTAERLVLELREKFEASLQLSLGDTDAGASSELHRIELALFGMGFSTPEVVRARHHVEEEVRRSPRPTTAALVRAALVFLAKGSNP